jgi:hypothetical protein
MKLFSIVALVLASSALATPISRIPDKDRVILKGDWTPTPVQTQKALEAIEKNLRESPVADDAYDRESLLKIRSGELDYRVQFKGERKDGRDSITCTFFLPSVIELHGKPFLDWRKDGVMVYDAGYEFWWDRYYPDSGSVE